MKEVQGHVLVGGRVEKTTHWLTLLDKHRTVRNSLLIAGTHETSENYHTFVSILHRNVCFVYCS